MSLGSVGLEKIFSKLFIDLLELFGHVIELGFRKGSPHIDQSGNHLPQAHIDPLGDLRYPIANLSRRGSLFHLFLSAIKKMGIVGQLGFSMPGPKCADVLTNTGGLGIRKIKVAI